MQSSHIHFDLWSKYTGNSPKNKRAALHTGKIFICSFQYNTVVKQPPHITSCYDINRYLLQQLLQFKVHFTKISYTKRSITPITRFQTAEVVLKTTNDTQSELQKSYFGVLYQGAQGYFRHCGYVKRPIIALKLDRTIFLRHKKKGMYSYPRKAHQYDVQNEIK